MSRLLILMLIAGLMPGLSSAQTREEKVRADRRKVEALGYWIYNDMPKALAEARRTGKPMVAVLRCIPCVECVKLDDDVIEADERVKPLLDQFVRVRVVSTNGLDLSLFQFDTDQSFAIFLFNADGAIYGRFGTRSHRTEWASDVSVEGLVKSLRGALALHKEYPHNRNALAAKRGPAPEFARPELYPALEKKYKPALASEGNIAPSCIHCHQIGEAVRELAFERKQRLPESTLFPFPHPKIMGLILNPQEMATVLKVLPDTDAQRAGFEPGDIIAKLAGQPLLSIADVQWVFNAASPDGAELNAEVVRAGQTVPLTLKLAKGWRQRDDISWRASSWSLRRVALGGMNLAELPDEERAKLNLPRDSTALLVKHVGQYAPHDLAFKAGVRSGDVLIAFNGRTHLLRETDILAYGLREMQAGDKVELTLLREGKRQELSFTRSR